MWKREADEEIRLGWPLLAFRLEIEREPKNLGRL